MTFVPSGEWAGIWHSHQDAVMPACFTGILGSRPRLCAYIQLPANVEFRRPQMMAPVYGSLSPMWETQIEFQTSGSVLPLQTFEE